MSRRFEYFDEDAIRELLVGRSVVKVDDDQLALDDGTVLTIHANAGCGGCSAGWYDLVELADAVNMIMAVEFSDEPLPDRENGYAYRVFVLAENRRIKLLEVDGDDGNGYYGTGYWIEVTP